MPELSCQTLHELFEKYMKHRKDVNQATMASIGHVENIPAHLQYGSVVSKDKDRG